MPMHLTMPNPLNKLTSLITSQDQFGTLPQVTFKRAPQHITFIGGMYSILLNSLVFWLWYS